MPKHNDKPMKIIAVGRNYVDHIHELKNEIPTQPVIFTKPDTAILKNNETFYLPEWSKDVHHELEVVLKISKPGKYIEERFAPNYYEEIGIGIDFTARDLQSELKSKGLPWDLAKGFNDSAPISEFYSKEQYDLNHLNFSLWKNGQEVQKGNTSYMMYKFDYIISFVSKYFTLKTGDLIFTGTPAGVSRVESGDHLEGFLEDKKLLDFKIK